MSNSEIIAKDERYTPTQYIDSVKIVLGNIDLDPASSRVANSRIKADYIYTTEDSGLMQKWFGNIFLNPPYSRGNLLKWSEKIVKEFNKGNFKNGIYLVPNGTDTNWFTLLNSFPFCLIDHRICFLTYNERIKKFFFEKNPENGSCFFLFTKSKEILENFCDEFSKYGPIYTRIR